MTKQTKATTKHRGDSAVTIGSANVFADLGFRGPDEMLAKSQFVDTIRIAIRERRLTQQKASALIGLAQPKISALLSGDSKGFSFDRLMRILTRLGYDVTIAVAPEKERARGSIRVETSPYRLYRV